MNGTCLILMVRSPEGPNVKSRLAKDIGEEKARSLYKCFGLDLLKSISSPLLDIAIGYHPEGSEKIIHEWLGVDHPLVAQKGKDLGEKQAYLLENAFEKGYRSAIVMISDGPDIPRKHVNIAIQNLKESDAVIGPCFDGGYYLLGFNRGSFNGDIFTGMTWGEGDVSCNISNRILTKGLNLSAIDPWWDVDHLEDLKLLYHRSKNSGKGSKTLEYIQEMIKENDLSW